MEKKQKAQTFVPGCYAVMLTVEWCVLWPVSEKSQTWDSPISIDLVIGYDGRGIFSRVCSNPQAKDLYSAQVICSSVIVYLLFGCHSVPIRCYCMEKSSMDILLNFSLCVPQKKVNHMSLDRHADEFSFLNKPTF